MVKFRSVLLKILKKISKGSYLDLLLLLLLVSGFL